MRVGAARCGSGDGFQDRRIRLFCHPSETANSRIRRGWRVRYGTTRWTGLPRMVTSQVVTSCPDVPTVYSIFHQPGCVSPGGVGALYVAGSLTVSVTHWLL